MSVSIPRPFWKLGLAFLVGLVGCADTPPPVPISKAEITVRKANSMGAAEHAPRELEDAIKKLGLAAQALENGQNEVARRLVEQAQVNGELAEAITRTAKARKKADNMPKNVNAPSEVPSAILRVE